jgi:hypothetical protein
VVRGLTKENRTCLQGSLKVERHTCDIKNYRGFYAKGLQLAWLTVIRRFDPRAGIDLSCRSWCGRRRVVAGGELVGV